MLPSRVRNRWALALRLTEESNDGVERHPDEIPAVDDRSCEMDGPVGIFFPASFDCAGFQEVLGDG